MVQRVVVAGSGFAGLWSALSAARAVDLAGKNKEVEVVVVSPSSTLVIRPRLYEAVIANMDPDLAPLFAAVGVSPRRSLESGRQCMSSPVALFRQTEWCLGLQSDSKCRPFAQQSVHALRMR